MPRFLLRLLQSLFALAIIGMLSLAAVYYFLAPKLPDTASLREVRLQIPLRIYSSEGLMIAEFGEKRRIPAGYDAIPGTLIEAFLAAEDDRFFEHPGVDYQGILRAAYSLLVTGEKTQGGSTITMQVARNFFLSREKTYLRKLNEIILALKIEQTLSKEEILALYLNKIYLGSRAYGVGAAAEVYYGKALSELTLAEMAMIAGLPKAPSASNPIANPERALQRRNYVLSRMLSVGFIDKAAYQAAVAEPVSARYHNRDVEVYAPYVAEMIRTTLFETYGEQLYTDGIKVHTTINKVHQQAATSALQEALSAYDRRHGYRGAIQQLEWSSLPDAEQAESLLDPFQAIGGLQPALVLSLNEADTLADVYIRRTGNASLTFDAVSWAQPKISTNRLGKKPKKLSEVITAGDVIYLKQNQDNDWQLAQIPEAEAAMVALSPYDGGITALQGGFDFFHNKFNRVTQTKRQPGSGFKPIIYSAALERGYTAASIINDAPVVFDDVGLENVWRPENYSGQFYGPTRLREALTHSRNLVSIRLMRDIGINYVVDYAKQFGFDPDQLPRNLSLALGSGSAAPIDMARAYAVFANGGYLIEPYLIKRVEDSDGNILQQAEPATVCETCITPIEAPEQVDADPEQQLVQQWMGFKPAPRIISAQNAYLMSSMLRDVVKFGTGRQALTLGRNDLAGKTGTTNDQVDAWFNGFTPELVAVSWVGFDTPRSLGHFETGGRAALPMWIDFMREALANVPEEPFRPPVDMVTVRIDPETGLLARPGSDDGLFETFRTGEVPQTSSQRSTNETGESEQTDDALIELF
ncbi:Multimodular transpeptidase-transglycosylase [Methylophaga frappieri]|uniref:Penicillin-binding protein 1A n=1 Tax=Methylophaga frappieri (strain ATCC BAA-2434 / DSM 25690 / JAM7) TaxID=754477 RepID=I1YJ38_METFJ|nr:penicillin-binding protein 1A [Methylophaga frappieri]AFJ02931.1 Multimodular transpeptidase-transglycosylase [Methylophaga frappieri]